MNKSNYYLLLSSSYHRKHIFMISLGKGRKNFPSLTSSYFLRSAVSLMSIQLSIYFIYYESAYNLQSWRHLTPHPIYQRNFLICLCRFRRYPVLHALRSFLFLCKNIVFQCVVHFRYRLRWNTQIRWKEKNKRELWNKNHFVQWIEHSANRNEKFFCVSLFFCTRIKVVKYASKFYRTIEKLKAVGKFSRLKIALNIDNISYRTVHIFQWNCMLSDIMIYRLWNVPSLKAVKNIQLSHWQQKLYILIPKTANYQHDSWLWMKREEKQRKQKLFFCCCGNFWDHNAH